MKKTAPAPARRPSPALAAPADREPGIGPGMAAALYFGLALLYFLPAFLPGAHIFGTDYLQAGYFFYDFISQRTAEGHLPGWVPHVYGGLPLFSNPGSTYYPLRWVADFVGPTRLFFPILFWFQFAMAGLGMYLLARELGCRRWVAFVAGLCFQWTGITTSWVYAGHDGRIIVVTLAPLFFHFLHAGIRTGRLAHFAGLAATTAFVLLSFQIQNAYYLLLAGAIWAVFCLVHLGVAKRPAALAKTAALGVAAVALGFVTASVNFIPFMDYVAQSPRGQTEGRGYEFSTSFSMPPRAILGLAVPEQVGANIQDEQGQYVFPVYRGENAFRLHTEYVGATVLVLVALGALYARRNRYFWFFAGLGLFALTLALGGNTPLYRLYYEVLPGLKRFRAPDLAYYVLALSLITMAALALERLAELRSGVGRRPVDAGTDAAGLGRVPVVAFGVAGVALLGGGLLGPAAAGMAEGTVGLTPALGWVRFAFFAGLVALVLWLWTSEKMTAVGALVLLSLVTTVDLWVMGKKFFQTVPAPEEMYAQDGITTFLKSQPGPFRVWPLPGQSAWPPAIDYPMLYGIEQAGGEHGNQLQRYNQYAGAGERTYVDFHNFLGDPRFMAAANVRYLTASAEFQEPWLREVYRGQSAIVYENLNALPRAWLVGEVVAVPADSTLSALLSPRWDPARNAVVEADAAAGLGLGAGGPVQGGARVTRHEPDVVEVATEADRPALLVLADNYYDGWRATVDGRPAEIHRTNHTFRGVAVPAGRHQVRFVFEPTDLYTGFWIYLACLALLAAYGAFLLVGWMRARRVTSEPAPAAG